MTAIRRGAALGALGAVLLAGCAAPAAEAEDPPRVVAPPAAQASSVPAAIPPERQRIVVHGTGDVNLDPDYVPALGAHGYAHAWSGLAGLLAADDLTVINLECPVSDRGTIVPKEFTFRCAPAALPAARAAGVEVANLANNHSGDYGPVALLDSVRHARDAGIEPVGVGADIAEATRPAIVEVGGWRVAVLGFGGGGPQRPPAGHGLPPRHGERRRQRLDDGRRPRRRRAGRPGVRLDPLGRGAGDRAAAGRRRAGPGR